METRSLSLHRFLLSRILWFLLPIVAALMATHWYIERQLLLRVFDESLEERAMTLATLMTSHAGKVELEFADEYMPQYSRAESPMFFQIWLPDGSTLERSVSLGTLELPRQYGSLERPRSFWTDLDRSTRLRAIGIEFPLRLGTQPERNPVTSVVVVVAAGEEQLEAVLIKGNLEAAVTGVLAIGGIIAVVVLALGRGIRLLEGVGRDVESLTRTSLAGPVDLASTPREIRPIAERLNRAMASVTALVERERRFNADAAHELRTPLTELKAAIDVALKWPDAGTLESALVECRGITRRMEALVESLLNLSRLESADAFEELSVDLAQFLRVQVEHACKAPGGGQSLRFVGPEHLHVVTSPVLWEIVARNLVENALDHSTPDSLIEVDLEASPEGVCFSVKNRVEGFDESMVERCTERFWRRAGHGAGNDHFGLGLSIVAAACEKMGQRFRSSYSDGVFGAHVESLPR